MTAPIRFQGVWTIDTGSIMKASAMSVREKTNLATTMRDAFTAVQAEIGKLPENTRFELKVHENKPILKIALNVPQTNDAHEESIPQEKRLIGLESLSSVVKRGVAFVKAMTVNTAQPTAPALKDPKDPEE